MSSPRLVHFPRNAVLALIALIGLGVSLALVPPVARGADETATAGMSLKASSGKLYRQLPKAANLSLGVEVKAPFPASPKILPMKRVTVDFPTDMKFVPKRNFPVCPDNQIGPPPVNLSVPPQTAIARCPKAVLGNGSAQLYLAAINSASGPNLKDPVLVVFNGGRTRAGLARIKVYGFSKGTGAGVYMSGVLQRNGTLTMSIPVLTFDSAVGQFSLNIPATSPVVYDGKPVPGSVGRDRSYVEARCSTGTWRMKADFVFGTRDDAGRPTSPDSNVSAPPVTEGCYGRPGHPHLKWVKVKGPWKMRRGQKRTFYVRVSNNGTAVAKRVRVTAYGKWMRRNTRRAANLWPGRTRWVKVPVRMKRSARRHQRTVVKFRVSAAHTKAKTGRKRVWVR